MENQTQFNELKSCLETCGAKASLMKDNKVFMTKYGTLDRQGAKELIECFGFTVA